MVQETEAQARPPLGGTLEVLTGVEAVARAEAAICRAAVSRDAATAEGLALAGATAASLGGGRQPDATAGASALPASCVHHVVAAPGRERWAAFELAATSAQQAVDHCFAAHLLSRRIGRAGICSLTPSLAEGLCAVRVPAQGRVARQALASGTPLEIESDPSRIPDLAREALNAVAEQTGRPAAPLERTGDPGAPVVLFAAGAEAAVARELAASLSRAGVPAAALGLVLVRPFPRALVREALAEARMIFVIKGAAGASGLVARIRAALGEKAEVRTLRAGARDRMLEELTEQLPSSASDPPCPIADVPAPASRRLAVAPGGPGAERTLRDVLRAMARLGSLHVEPRVRRHLGAPVVCWESVGLNADGGDLLIVFHPGDLDLRRILALVRKGSTVVLVAAPQSQGDPGAVVDAAAAARLHERGLQLHWLAAPLGGEPDSDPAPERAASRYVAGAALAALQGASGNAVETAAAALEAEQCAEEAHWLREGASSVRVLDLNALDAERSEREVDFRPPSTLPHLPRRPESGAEGWGERIARFHRTGTRGFDPAPPAPLRPALLGTLSHTLRARPPHPFVLAGAEDAASPVAAHRLSDLLQRAAEDSSADRVLADNLDTLLAGAARLLSERAPGDPLDGLLADAGERLVRQLALPEAEASAFRDALERLRGALPPEALALSLRRAGVVRLYRGVLEAVRAPLRRSFVARLEALREGLRDLLRLDRLASAEGRDPEALAAALGDGAGARLDTRALADALPAAASGALLGDERKQRIGGALAAIEEHLDRLDERPRVVFFRPPELGLQLGEAQRRHPDPLAAAVGYFDGTAQGMAPLFRAVRVARLELEGSYEPERHDAALAELDWQALTEEELAAVPAVAAVTTGARLRRRGLGSLSELLRSSRPVHVLVLDDVGAADEAEDLSLFHIDLAHVVIAHREAFALGSTLARPERLAEGLRRLVRAQRPGVALIRLPGPAPAAWRALLAEAALWGRACPDFRYDPDAGSSWADRFDLEGNPQLDRSWPVAPLRYLDEQGAEAELEVSFTFADAMALEPAYLRHLWLAPPEAWRDDQVPLAEFLADFEPESRDARIPFLWVVDGEGALQRAIVTRELAMACRDRLRAWRAFQELAGHENVYVDRALEAARAESQREAAALEEVHRADLERARGEAAHGAMERLAAVLMSPEGVAAATSGLTLESLPAPIAGAPAASVPALETSAEPAAETVVEDAEEALVFDEPYVDCALCTTCNECTNLNSRLFQYNAEKQAFIADAAAGSFAELVKAAELCPARCIHPGRPRSDDPSATPELIERAAAFA